MFTKSDAFYGVSVSDLAAAKTFYKDKLGLELLDESMGLMFRLGSGSRLFVYEKPDHHPASFTVLNFPVDDIDAVINQLKEKGIAMEHYDLGNEAEQDEKGVLRGLSANMGPDIAWFKDPAGNVLSIVQEK